jgi:hypothetical protein
MASQLATGMLRGDPIGLLFLFTIALPSVHGLQSRTPLNDVVAYTLSSQTLKSVEGALLELFD